MKISIIATLVVLSLAHGCLADTPADLEKITQYFEEMRGKIAQELAGLVGNQDLAGQAQTFVEEKRTQLEPLVAQLQEQLRTLMSGMEEHIQPLAANVQAQMQPMLETMQRQLEQIQQQARAIGN